MQKSNSQHTLKSAVTVAGVGVHSGASATLTLKPALPNSGIVFIRTDIADKNNIVPAKWDNVVDARLHTVIANKAGVTVSTVEHVLSACAALGLDNAVINIDGPEIPIMDGSARDFVAALDKAGLQRQNAPRRVLRVKKTVSYQEGDKEIYLSPADGQYFGFEIDFASPVIGRQKYTHQMKEEIYRKEIATARTFGFVHEVEQLRKMGLARGASLDNAIGIDGDKVMNPEGLRFPNEFVRHKILDAIGDLYLCGMQIIGHYHGVKAGHAMNNKLLHVLFSQPDAFEIVELAAEAQPLRAVPTGMVYGQQEQIAAVA
jgi:UDP-3-O-[3-hydroxymyristoyl] N-acetylglucosamine deacetylase